MPSLHPRISANHRVFCAYKDTSTNINHSLRLALSPVSRDGLLGESWRAASWRRSLVSNHLQRPHESIPFPLFNRNRMDHSITQVPKHFIKRKKGNERWHSIRAPVILYKYFDDPNCHSKKQRQMVQKDIAPLPQESAWC